MLCTAPMLLEARAECERCKRPVVVCYCDHVTRIDTRTRVLVLQHPRESEKAVGTARIAALCLPNAEVAVGVAFESDRRVQALVSDAARPAVLLYPSEDARDLATEPPEGDVTLVVLDGTWAHARQLFRKNPWLRSLPRYAFTPDKPSEYRIRREPAPEYVSTIEALAKALGALEGDAPRFDALLVPFRAMVDTQIAYAERSTGGRTRRKRRRNAKAPSRIPPELLAPSLVCVTGEANAWPYEKRRTVAPYPHELVHWTALRLDDQLGFEALIAPRHPLARSPMVHARLPEDRVRAGLSWPELDAQWRAFVRPDDVLCTWGPYALELFRDEHGYVPERVIDIRKVVGDVTQKRPGSLEQQVASLGLAYEARGLGRGGERLGMLAALTTWLVSGGYQASADETEG